VVRAQCNAAIEKKVRSLLFRPNFVFYYTRNNERGGGGIGGVRLLRYCQPTMDILLFDISTFFFCFCLSFFFLFFIHYC
jgi:hypothetical protein